MGGQRRGGGGGGVRADAELSKAGAIALSPSGAGGRVSRRRQAQNCPRPASPAAVVRDRMYRVFAHRSCSWGKRGRGGEGVTAHVGFGADRGFNCRMEGAQQGRWAPSLAPVFSRLVPWVSGSRVNGRPVFSNKLKQFVPWHGVVSSRGHHALREGRLRRAFHWPC